MTSPTSGNEQADGGVGATMHAGAATAGTSAERTTAGVAREAAAKARALADKAQGAAKSRARSTADTQKSKAADTIGSVAQSLRGSTEELERAEHPEIGRFIAQAADRMESIAEYLRTTETDELVRRAEDIARRQPALFLGGAFALGVIGARFVKSSRRAQFDGAEGDRAVPIDTVDERGYGLGASSAGAYGTGGLASSAFGGASFDATIGGTTPAGTGGSGTIGASRGTLGTEPADELDLDVARPRGLDDPDARA